MQRPAEAPAIGRGRRLLLQAYLPPLHRGRRGGRQHAVAGSNAAVREMHRDELHEIRRAHRGRGPGGFHAVRKVGNESDALPLGVFRIGDVPNGAAMAQRVFGQRHGLLHPERFEDAIAHGVVVGFAPQHLDEAAEQREADVAVRHLRAEREQIRQQRHHRHETRDRVVAATRIDEEIAVDAGRVASAGVAP